MIKYKNPKKGLFNIPGESFDNGSWDVEAEREIIGEDEDIYITEFRVGEFPYNDQHGKYTAVCTYWLGVHKSRLIKWLDIQLKMFN